MRVLVTGGAGFIGSHLVDRFLELGYEVRVLDNLEPRVHPHGRPKYLSTEIEFIQGDVRDKSILTKVLRDVDIVSHQAAYQDYMFDYSKFIGVNAFSTALLFEIIREKGIPIQRVVVASSQAVYGEGQYECPDHGILLPEARKVSDLEKGMWEVRCPKCDCVASPVLLTEQYANPYNAYALSKFSEELVAIRLGRNLDIPTVALRYSITQGTRQSPFNVYSGICRIFTTRLKKGEPPIVFEDGHQTRDFVHVQDVVDAHIIVLDDSSSDYEVFNVGSGIKTRVLDYAEKLIQVLGITDINPEVTGEYRIGDNRHSVSCIDKLQKLGWTPRRSLNDIFVEYINWIDQHELISDSFAEADRTMREMGVIRRIRAKG